MEAKEVAGLSPVEGTGNIGRRNRRVVLQGCVRELAPGRRATLGVMVLVFSAFLFVEVMYRRSYILLASQRVALP